MSLADWIQGAFPSSGLGLLADFANPPISARPKLRWWWPHGVVDVDEIKAEIDEMLEGGFGGAEINDVHPSIHVSMDPAGHGWATGPWLDAIRAASDHAKSRGFQIDVALGPSYPASVPTLSPDDPGAEKEVVTGRAYVVSGATYSGPVPAPYTAAGPGVNNETLIALQAWRVHNGSLTTAVPVVLDLGTKVDLLKQVSGGNITFTPPVDGSNSTWVVISYRMRGTGQLAEAGPHNTHDGAVIDHLSLAGIQASTDYWDQNILSPELKSLFHEIGGSFFEDSIELEYSTLWTPRLRCEFKRRMGYDLYTVLPAIVQEKQKNAFSFSDAEVTRGVINDFWDTMGQLYVDYHAKHMREWSAAQGMKFRAQTYGLPTEAMASSAAVDIPEGESLGFKNMGDYRSLAGAANMKGLSLISNEACAFAASAYTVTLKLLLQTLNPIFTSGNNHQVFHGFSYKAAETAQWPGFAAFTPYSGNIGYSESWGPRIPLWRHMSDTMGYVGRVQAVLQRGQPKHDVAFFEQKGYVGAGYNSPWFADSGTMLGWSLNIIGPSLLDLPSATVRDKLLAPDGPGYQLLAFEGDAFTSSREPMAKLSSAKKILEFAKAGLPILIAGDWSVVNSYGYGESPKTPEITSIFAEILSHPNVATVATRDDFGPGVAKIGVVPRVQYNSSQLISYQRVDGDLDHFLLVAASPATYAVSTKTKVTAVEADVLLPRRSKDGVPFLMDLWTGDVTPVGQYEEISDTQIKVHVSLRAYQGMMITVAPVAKAPVHAVRSTAQSVQRKDAGLFVRSNITATVSSELSSGEVITSVFDNIPAAQELKNWTLHVQDWQPTSDLNSTDTIYVNHTLQLDTLAPWTNFTELQDVSGLGWYTTSFDLGESWPADAGAMLSIPSIVGSFRLTLNGQKLPPQDQLDVNFDVGPWLRKGVNTIEIEVATTLLNRLRITQAGVYGVATRQAYGLVGPISLSPYREAKIAS
ncbi:secreted protein [Thozetella sp. PMI_491]|nr:secreted protein [Thozetella sp. PMI_491]